MLDLINSQFVRGVNPNLAAGQRALKIPSPLTGYNRYELAQVKDNAFYNFGNGSFTIHVRYLDLGYLPFYGQTQILDKSLGAATGWSLEITGNDYASNHVRFVMKSGGGVVGFVQDPDLAPLDGLFHSYTVTKSVSALTPNPTDITYMRLFRDGLELNALKAGNSDPGAVNSNNPVLFGGGGDHQVRGYMDVALFYSVGLTDAEIAVLDNSLLRTDRQAKFIHEFNQVPTGLASDYCQDGSSVGQNSEPYIQGGVFQFVKIGGIKTFGAGVTQAPPLNGHFIPANAERVTGINRFDSDLTAEYSLDGVNWNALAWAGNQATNFPASVSIDPNGLTPMLYLRATNANAAYLNALEINY